jgi:hypothetical protein
VQGFLRHYWDEFEYFIANKRSIVDSEPQARRSRGMSAQPTAPNKAPDQVSIEIDGKPMNVAKGAMIIQAADDAGIPIPRFCYHKKLPIAANCRMCLVDVEKAPKPMPACATPVMEGMKVFTQSRRSLDAQRNVMEFLLINHPLDCPICDQGGECELQDLAMGLRPLGQPLRRAQARGAGRGPRPAGRHRHDALHPVHALRALRERDRRHQRARRHGARRGSRDRHRTSARRSPPSSPAT